MPPKRQRRRGHTREDAAVDVGAIEQPDVEVPHDVHRRLPAGRVDEARRGGRKERRQRVGDERSGEEDPMEAIDAIPAVEDVQDCDGGRRNRIR